MKTVLGISGFYHDSAAALLVDGQVVAAAQEERFTRRRHDARFPEQAIRFVLARAGLPLDEVDTIAFYEKPFVKFERLLETYHAFAPAGLASFMTAMPVWIKEKLFTQRLLSGHLRDLGDRPRRQILYPEHHLSHAASAFYPSPYEEAAILTVDGVGEWATTTIAHGQGHRITLLGELRFPHSIGLLYSAFTYYAGFTVNSGEYKLMGLAPYGDPDAAQTTAFIAAIRESLVDIREDGSIVLDMRYFDFATGLRMANVPRWEALFGLPRRDPAAPLTQAYMNLALAIQRVTEEVILALARTARALTGCSRLVMAGGVALNCVANGRLLRSGLVDDVWIQPAAGDAGGALGAAYAAWHIHGDRPRAPSPHAADGMAGSYLGPSFPDEEIAAAIGRHDGVARRFGSSRALAAEVARRLAGGEAGGWFQGRMEFGPRALGNRSIIADARNPEMQKRLNLQVKQREGFRPFAPSVLEEYAADYFEIDRASPYMLLVTDVTALRRRPLPEDDRARSLYDRLYWQRSDIPAVTHVDYSARVQTVGRDTNPRYWELIDEFRALTGCPVIVNTSFNVRGEPIVCTPADAYRCFVRTDLQFLAIGSFLLDKAEQPEVNRSRWRTTFAPD